MTKQPAGGRLKRAARKRLNRRGLLRLLWYVVRAILLLGLMFMIVYPLLVKFSTSIKGAADQADPSVIFIPKEPTMRNYWLVFLAVDYPLTLLKTIGFTLLNSVLQIASCVFVAYGLARFRFKGNRLVFGMTLSTLIIPSQMILLPLYFRFRFFNPVNPVQMFLPFFGQMSGIDLTNTIVPFICLSITAVAFKNGLYIFMLRQYFKNMPTTLEEAAYVDGAGIVRTFLRIMVPGAMPIILTVFLFSFVWMWNDSFYVSMLAPELSTLGNKLFSMTFTVLGEASDIFNAVLSTPKFFLLIAPLIILYVFTQQFFTESIEKSGMVG